MPPLHSQQVAAQPVGSIRAMDNDAQLVFQAQLGNSLLEVCALCGATAIGSLQVG